MKQSLYISPDNLKICISTIHKLKQSQIDSEDDIFNSIELIVNTLNLNNNLTISKIQKNKDYTFKVTIESKSATAHDFTNSLGLLTNHISLSRPFLNEKIDATDIVNIVNGYFQSLPVLYELKSNLKKHVGITNEDEELIKVKFSNPKYFTFISIMDEDKSKKAFDILLSKNYINTLLRNGKNLFAFVY